MNSLVYIAIDFGTAYSGYALKFNSKQKQQVITDVKWGQEYGINSCKTPTCILFDKSEAFIDFGYAAMRKYTLTRSSKASSEYFFENFKMDLYRNKNIQSDFVVTAANGKTMPAMKVFSESLRYLKDHAIKRLNSTQANSKLKDSDVTWVLTVPAIWSDAAKHFMREAAKQAGMVTDSDADRLIMALEPEAASVYCKHLPSDEFVGGEESRITLDHNSGTQYIVADCGGGTIDITAHEVLDGGMLKEVYKASGNDLGGQNIDKQMKAFLKEVFGEGCWNEYEKKHTSEMQKLMYEFASGKCSDWNEGFSFSCAWNLKILAEKHIRGDLEEHLRKINGISWNEGSIEITPDKFRSFFDESLRGTAKILKDILEDPELNIEYLLLVGGYAKCQILQDYIRLQFGSKCQVLCPLMAQEAVMAGAADFGSQPHVVASRICGLTYGIAVVEEFDLARHKTGKLFVNSDGVPHCDDLFKILVKRGESVKYYEVRDFTFSATDRRQISADFRFFSTTRKSATYVDEWGIDEIAGMTVPMSDTKGGLNRTLKLNVKFGLTEIKATATDITTGISREVMIDFMRKGNEGLVKEK